jgi:hypothetical protein
MLLNISATCSFLFNFEAASGKIFSAGLKDWLDDIGCKNNRTTAWKFAQLNI